MMKITCNDETFKIPFFTAAATGTTWTAGVTAVTSVTVGQSPKKNHTIKQFVQFKEFE